MLNPIYVLTEEERLLAEKIGKARCEAKSARFRYNDSGFHSYNGDRAFPHILGVCAEIAYANLTNTKLDENIYAKGDDTDFDGIEIKTSTWKGDDIELKVKTKEYVKKTPKAYVLARIDEEYKTVQFVGSISRKKFEQIKYERKHKFVENYCVEARKMSKGLAIVDEGILKLVKFQ